MKTLRLSERRAGVWAFGLLLCLAGGALQLVEAGQSDSAVGVIIKNMTTSDADDILCCGGVVIVRIVVIATDGKPIVVGEPKLVNSEVYYGDSVHKNFDKASFTWTAKDIGPDKNGTAVSEQHIVVASAKNGVPLSKTDSVFVTATKSYTYVRVYGEYYDTTHMMRARDSIDMWVASGSTVVASPDRVIPSIRQVDESAAAAPVVALTAELTVGPNPASRSSDALNFFRHGSRVAYATLSIYDASGNIVRKIRVIDDAVDSQSRRKVSSWNLRDSKGRLVSDGTYLVKGVLKTSGGNRERVSVVVGVR
jgi:hypothetical protein